MPLGPIENVVANRKRKSTVSISYSLFYDDLEDVEYDDPDFSSNKENRVKRSKKGESKSKRKVKESEREASLENENETRSSITITKITKVTEKQVESLDGSNEPSKDTLSQSEIDQSNETTSQVEHHEESRSQEVGGDLVATKVSLFQDQPEIEQADTIESDEESIMIKPIKRVKKETKTSKVTSKSKKKSVKMTSRERRLKKEADEKRQQEEQAIDAWRKEMEEIENYKLVVETGPHD